MHANSSDVPRITLHNWLPEGQEREFVDQAVKLALSSSKQRLDVQATSGVLDRYAEIRVHAEGIWKGACVIALTGEPDGAADRIRKLVVEG